MQQSLDFGRLQSKQIIGESSSQVAIFLHGYGANAADLYPLHELIQFKSRTDWIFPEGILELDYFDARAWFPIDMLALQDAISRGQHRNFSQDCPPGFKEAVNELKFAIESLSSSYERIILGGFSQGAMLASHLALELPQVQFAILFSTNLVDAKHLRQISKARTNKLEFFQSHGLYDSILSFQSAKDFYEILNSDSHKGIFVEFPGAHEIPNVCIQKLNEISSKI